MNVEKLMPEKSISKEVNTTPSEINDKRIDNYKTTFDTDITDVNDHRISDFETKKGNEMNSEITDNLDDYYSTYKERIDQTPTENSSLGTWEGIRGESKFLPEDNETKQCLEKYGIDGIEYKNGIPNFDPITLEKVKIDMGVNRFSIFDGDRTILGNYEKADNALAEKWNANKKDGKEDWTKNDIKSWVREEGLVRHENNDMTTVSYMPRKPHHDFTHLGGVSECIKKMFLNPGGGFDE